MRGVDIDRIHADRQDPAKPMSTAEIIDAWHQHLARKQAAADELAVLTPAQRELLIYIAKGFTGKEIAGLIHKSAKFVELHSMKLRQALDMSTFEAVTLAIRAEWV